MCVVLAPIIPLLDSLNADDIRINFLAYFNYSSNLVFPLLNREPWRGTDIVGLKRDFFGGQLDKSLICVIKIVEKNLFLAHKYEALLIIVFSAKILKVFYVVFFA